MPKYCTKCQTTKEDSEFWKTKNRRGEPSLQGHCKACKLAYKKLHWHREKANNTKKAREKTYKRKQQLLELFGNTCSCCNKIFHQSCMDFHHVTDDKHERGVAYYLQSSIQRAAEEADKCIVLCANCHRFLHHAAPNLHKQCVALCKEKDLTFIKNYLIYNLRGYLDNFNTQTPADEPSS